MPDYIIWSAPEEPYEKHIELCLDSWEKLKIRILPTLSRLFQVDANSADKTIGLTILCHDIGKLSHQWQDNIHKPKAEIKRGPPHATLGAPYLLILNGSNFNSLSSASALAILMHHTDSSLAQGNLEHPAEDAINRGLVEYGTENIRWVKGADEAFRQTLDNFPEVKQNAKPLGSIKLKSLENIAKQLRLWARCPVEIERHQRRLQALAIHHILKVCDWRAASQRPQVESDEEGEEIENRWQDSILNIYNEGGLLV